MLCIHCNNAKYWPVQGHSGHNFGTIRKLIYDFMLVSNTNTQHTLHHFQVIADYWSILCFQQGYLSLTHWFRVIL